MYIKSHNRPPTPSSTDSLQTFYEMDWISPKNWALNKHFSPCFSHNIISEPWIPTFEVQKRKGMSHLVPFETNNNNTNVVSEQNFRVLVRFSNLRGSMGIQIYFRLSFGRKPILPIDPSKLWKFYTRKFTEIFHISNNFVMSENLFVDNTRRNTEIFQTIFPAAYSPLVLISFKFTVKLF